MILQTKVQNRLYKLRTSSHTLNNGKDRYNNTPRNHVNVNFPEREYHFLLVYPMYMSMY